MSWRRCWALHRHRHLEGIGRAYNAKLCGGCSSVGRVPDCDSGRRGFESHQPPHRHARVIRPFGAFFAGAGRCGCVRQTCVFRSRSSRTAWHWPAPRQRHGALAAHARDRPGPMPPGKARIPPTHNRGRAAPAGPDAETTMGPEGPIICWRVDAGVRTAIDISTCGTAPNAFRLPRWARSHPDSCCNGPGHAGAGRVCHRPF
jgi:hypothetical protein